MLKKAGCGLEVGKLGWVFTRYFILFFRRRRRPVFVSFADLQNRQEKGMSCVFFVSFFVFGRPAWAWCIGRRRHVCKIWTEL